jgi:chitin disaccharide deacetylase
MKNVIINADDFGASEGINNAIVDCFKDGILTSTTAMANMPAFDHAMRLGKKYNIPTGVHLNLIDGKGLVIKQPLGKKLALKVIGGIISRRIIEEEFFAQIEKVDKHVEITHLDSHQHMAMFPQIRSAMVCAAKEFKIKKARISKDNFNSITPFSAFVKKEIINTFIPGTKKLLRRNNIKYPHQFFGILSTGRFNLRYLEEYFKRVKNNAEIMVHPGYNTTPSNLKGDFLEKGREIETKTLLSQKAKDLCKKYNISLCSYKEL